MNRKYELFALAVVIASLVTLVCYSYYTMKSSNATCVERNSVVCPLENMCVSCYSIFTQAFPECCAEWEPRDNSKYAICLDDFMLIHGNDIVNVTDEKKFLDYCMSWERDAFLANLANMPFTTRP